ncbi:MAG: TRAP transporter substrate-binding protein [Thermoanaerobaculia bacterium]|nr:TRAP transporter substrate-binding protein [Thermoanaerobaculia bacterium]
MIVEGTEPAARRLRDIIAAVTLPRIVLATLRVGPALALVACLGCRGETEVVVLRLGHGLDPTHPVHRAMEVMAAEAASRSGGSLEIRIYPSEQLGSERECLELLQIGSLAMTKVSASVLESFAPALRVLSLPYLFRDREHLFAVLEGEIGDDLLAAPEPFRLRGLSFYDAGSRSFYTRERPVRHPDDLAGMKIRTQESATAIDMVEALGGAATPIAWGELYTALQQGVVDGAENNPPSFHLSRHYEIARFYSLDEHSSVPDVLVIGTLAWSRLTPDHRRVLTAAARVSAEHQKRLWRQATEEALAAVEAGGVEILRPDKAPFRQRVDALLERYADDPALAELILRIRALAGEAI